MYVCNIYDIYDTYKYNLYNIIYIYVYIILCIYIYIYIYINIWSKKRYVALWETRTILKILFWGAIDAAVNAADV